MTKKENLKNRLLVKLAKVDNITIEAADVELIKEDVSKEQREFMYPNNKFLPPKMFLVPSMDEVRQIMKIVNKIAILNKKESIKS